MRQIGDRPHVMSKPILIGYPGYRDDTGALVDVGLEIGGGHHTVPILHDTQLDAARRFERTIKNELRGVMQVVDDHVIARLQANSVGDDIFAFARRIEKPDFVGCGIYEARKLRTDGIAGGHQIAHLHRAGTFPRDVGLAGGNDGPRYRRYVG